jgi:branched-chain amino acid transport system substrate-binding protein
VEQRSAVQVGVSLLVASLALTACGARSNGDSAGGGSAEKVVRIGVVGPTTGEISAFGLGIQNSVMLAVRQANEAHTIPGWRIEVDSEDDEAKPDVGKNVATKFSSDPALLAVVGPYNTGVSQQIQPVLAAQHIAQVSPGNTGPGLTMGPKWQTAPQRQYDTYFRTCTTDAVQGPFAAQYLFRTAHITKVATISDKKAYGEGLVGTFTDEFKKLGGEIVEAQTVNPDDTDFQSVITKVKQQHPQAVYAGTEYGIGGPLSRQMKAAGLKVPLVGGDGLFDPQYIKLAGPASAGDLATSIGAPVEKLPSAKQFLADYAKAGFKDPESPYGGTAYDAATAIIKAMAVSLKDTPDVESARQATVDAVAKTSFDGVTGHVAFDKFGDTTTRVLTLNKVVAGRWAAQQTKNFGAAK